MIILQRILFVILIIILVLILILLVLLLYPFKYKLLLTYDKDSTVKLNIKYIIFRLKGFLSFKPKLKYELKLWRNYLLNSENDKKEKKKDNSIAKTDFIENKDIENEIVESKDTVKKLFKSAKNLEKKIDNKESYTKEEIENCVSESNNFFDRFKNIIPSKKISAIKKIVNEVLYSLNVIKPNYCKINIKYESTDPYTVGTVCAIAAPFYAILGDGISLKTSVKKDNIGGNILICGRPMLVRLIKPIFKIIFDKEIKSAFK